MEALSVEQDNLEQKGSLSQALNDVDATIARLVEARNNIVTGIQLTIQSCTQANVPTMKIPKALQQPWLSSKTL